VVLGILVAAGATGLPQGSAYDVLGSRLLPYIVAAGLALTGLAILIAGFVRRGPSEVQAPDLAPIVLIAVALVVAIVVIRTLGWIPVAAVVFALGARAFGSRRLALDLVLGLAFGAGTFVLFNYALGLNLPAGSWIR
jgi:putative tricarboxylic transport membrane protein